MPKTKKKLKTKSAEREIETEEKVEAPVEVPSAAPVRPQGPVDTHFVTRGEHTYAVLTTKIPA